MTNRHRPPRNPRNWRRAETLEPRRLLAAGNVFAQFEGEVSTPSEATWIDISILPEEFTASGGKVQMGFHLQPAAGSSLDPEFVEVFDAQGAVMVRKFARHDLPASTDSLNMVILRPGDYRLRLRGESGTAGAFHLDVYLVGDADGNRRVDQADRQIIFGANGAVAGDPGYSIEADTDLNGQITILTDGSHAFRSQGDATTLNPISDVSLEIEPEPTELPNGSLVSRVASVQVVGTTTPGARVEFDADNDGQFDDGAAVADSGGSFQFAASLALGANTLRVRAFDGFGQSRTQPLELEYVPATAVPLVLELDPSFDSAPQGDFTTLFDSATLLGTTDPNLDVELLELSRHLTSDSSGRFAIDDVPLAIGLNSFTVHVTDDHGNGTSTIINVSRVAPPANGITLAEGTDFATMAGFPVELGHDAGSHVLRFDVQPQFDLSDSTGALEDILLVYLVDPTNYSETLLDRGTPGTALFTLAGDQADFPPGRVRFDGRTVEIDVTSLGEVAAGMLVFQLLNSDADTGSVVYIGLPESDLDPGGMESPVVESPLPTYAPGESLDFTGFQPTTALVPSLRNVRFQTATGRYLAELSLENQGQAIGRQVAVAFPGLPPGVQLRGPSGIDGNGNPYLNLQPIVPPGGLAPGASTAPVTIEFANPMLIRFPITPVLYVGGPNRPPVFPALPPITVLPGDTQYIDLGAHDPDGDRLTYRLQPGAMPSALLEESGTLRLSPTPGEIGDYEVTFIVSDGAVEATQTLSISVVPDAITTTRLSGVVLATDQTPLANVPVGLGPLETTTDVAGRFQFANGLGQIPRMRS